MTYEELDRKLQGRCANRRKLGNNTYATRRTSMEGKWELNIVLHATEILTFYEDGSVKLNSGGYRSYTTKERINRYGPVRVYSDKGEWYIMLYPYELPNNASLTGSWTTRDSVRLAYNKDYRKNGRIKFFDGIIVRQTEDGLEWQNGA